MYLPYIYTTHRRTNKYYRWMSSVFLSTGTCFWLHCDAETIAQRLRQDEVSAEQRPALTHLDELEEIRELLKARHAFYQDAADHRIDTSGKTIDQVTQQIIECLQGNEPL